MKRFVSYLYSIYNNQKIHNSGFARIELRTGRNRIDIHLQESGYSGKNGTVYLFARKKENIQGISIGNIVFRNNQADFRYEQPEENIGQTPWQIMQMNGIIILIDGKVAFLSQWDEQPVDTMRFEIWNPQQAEDAGQPPADTVRDTDHTGSSPSDTHPAPQGETEDSAGVAENHIPDGNGTLTADDPENTQSMEISVDKPADAHRDHMSSVSDIIQNDAESGKRDMDDKSVPAETAGSRQAQQRRQNGCSPDAGRTSRNIQYEYDTGNKQYDTNYSYMEEKEKKEKKEKNEKNEKNGKNRGTAGITHDPANMQNHYYAGNGGMPAAGSGGPLQNHGPAGNRRSRGRMYPDAAVQNRQYDAGKGLVQQERRADSLPVQNVQDAVNTMQQGQNPGYRSIQECRAYDPVQDGMYGAGQGQEAQYMGSRYQGNHLVQNIPDAVSTIRQEQRIQEMEDGKDQPSPDSNICTAEIRPQPATHQWEQTWRYMLRIYPVLNQFGDNDQVICVRIEIKDVRLLPEKYWSVVNNSFLLHGFFNYRYLIFGKTGRNWIIGIPGIYQNQEHVMASIFGFPDFLAQARKNERGEQPGYWYRILDI